MLRIFIPFRRDIDATLSDGLLATTIERRATIAVAALTSLGLSAVAVFGAAETWPYVWLPVDLALIGLRFLLITTTLSRKGDAFRRMAHLCMAAGLVWCLWLGVAIVLCMAGSHVPLVVLAAILGTGVASGITSRNAGTPLYAGTIIIVVVAAVSAGALSSPYREMHFIALFSVPWLVSLAIILAQNHAVLVRLLRAERVAKTAAKTDALTGISNRICLSDWLTQARNEDVGVLYFDLDDFKGINDTFGHAAGDAVLQEVARRTQTVLRRDDDFIRMGGDEFCILLNDATPADCERIAERLLDTLASPFAIANDQLVKVGVSIGSTCAKGSGELPLNCADIALYKAKASGKGGHVHLAAA